ncbi:MAG: DEAD/DEAH box helicase family protein [Mameliella sp.]|nr:DEAD/DEAH box helicase family protein [Mameliella sp.]
MNGHVLIVANAVKARMMDADLEAKLLVSDKLSYYVDGAEHTSRFKTQGWSGRSSFLEFGKGIFPAGFLSTVVDHLRANNWTVTVRRKPIPAPLGLPVDEAYAAVNPFEIDPRYDYQPETVRRLSKYGSMIAQVATGGGKCHGKDTPIMMYDGTVKMVQDVVVGDQLMGPDSRPRNVLSTCSGRDRLYRVTPTKGDPYVVNSAHILSLKKTSRGFRGRKWGGEKYPKGEIVNVNVEDYLAETKTFRHIHKGWRAAVDFEMSEPLPIDPYFLGIMLGDGSCKSTVGITTMDEEIVEVVREQAEVWGLEIKKYGKPNNRAASYILTSGRTGGVENPLMAALRELGVNDRKHVPLIYRTASREDRMEILAGMLDTDGYYDGKCMYLTQKSEELLNGVIFIARSLGFAAYKKRISKTCCNNGKTGSYFTTVISGDIDRIPVRLARRKPKPRVQKKDVLVTGLSVETIGEGDYFGFELDGDHLYLLGDFTVTHNTMIAMTAVKHIMRPTLFLTTRQVLMYQMKGGFEDAGFKVGVMGDGEWRPTRGVNVGMVQTIEARLRQGGIVEQRMRKLLEIFELVILEEAHEAGSNSYFNVLNQMKNAYYRLALTATPFMRDDAEDNMRLMGVAGQIGITVSEKLLIERGILAKPIFQYRTLPVAKDLKQHYSWQRAYDIGIVKNETRNEDIVGRAAFGAGLGLPVMILVQRKAHGQALRDMCRARGLRAQFIHGAHDGDQRQRALDRLKRGEIDVLLGSTILDVGVDVPAVGMVILAGGGKAEVALRQRIGRGLREKKTGPNECLVIDYDDKGNKHLRKHAAARRAIIEATPGFVENILPKGREFDVGAYSAPA